MSKSCLVLRRLASGVTLCWLPNMSIFDALRNAIWTTLTQQDFLFLSAPAFQHLVVMKAQWRPRNLRVSPPCNHSWFMIRTYSYIFLSLIHRSSTFIVDSSSSSSCIMIHQSFIIHHSSIIIVNWNKVIGGKVMKFPLSSFWVAQLWERNCNFGQFSWLEVNSPRVHQHPYHPEMKKSFSILHFWQYWEFMNIRYIL